MSKVSRRKFLKGLGLTAVGAAVAACQPQTVIVTEEKIVKETVIVEKEAEQAVAPTSAEIRFMTRAGPLGLFMKEFAQIYSDKQEGAVNIIIEEGNWSDISTKLMTSAVAGTLADVFWQPYFYIPYHIASGVMLPMDDLVAASNVDTSIWYPWALEMETFDGKMWGLPMGVMTGYNTLIYNKEIIEKAGVPAPDGPNNTWEDLVEICKGIKENTDTWAIDIGHWWWGTETIVRNFDSNIVEFMGKESHFMDEKTQQAMKQIWDFAFTHEVMPTSASMEGDRNKMFVAGKLAILCNCAADVVTGMATAVGGRFPYDYSTIPQADRGLLGTQQQADSVHIYANCKYPNQAFGLCAEITGVEASKWTAVTTGMTPGACPAAWEDPEVAEKYPWYGVEGEWFKTNVPEPPPMPYNFSFNEVNTVWGAEWNPIKNGERPFDQENLQAVSDKIQEVLDQPRPA